MRNVPFVRFVLLGCVCLFVSYGEITEMVPNGIGFKAMSRYYKVMGPLGLNRGAFEEEEEEEEASEAWEENDESSGVEMKLQREEEEYLDYLEQKKLATQNGQNPEEVQESFTAKDFEERYNVGESRRNKTQKSDRRRRRKRFAVEDSDKYWYHGIVPYIFSSDIKDKDFMSRIRPKNRFHYWTCIRFVPWTKQTTNEYGLDHLNYLVHVQKNGCWSFVGNLKMSGQKISCCQDSTCLHELGHALGLHHEQKSPIHDDYLRINQNNIEPGKVSGYSEVDPSESRTFGYFDMGSVMLYNKYAFSTNGMPTMTIFDSSLDFLLNNPDPHLYYMFKEISDLYNCKELKCADFTMECKNGGYVAFVRNTCTCRCPRGLDPNTGCSTVYHGDKSLELLNWPSSTFSMLKPQDGCPSGFLEGSVTQYVKKSKLSQKLNLDIRSADDYI